MFPVPSNTDLTVLIFKPEELRWDAIHPSGLQCPRAIFYRLHKPELGNPYSWVKLAGLTFVGTALHKEFLPLLAQWYERMVYNVEIEKEVEGEIEGVKVKGRIDLLVHNPITDERMVVDCKFLHHTALRKIFPHHLHQIAVYCLLANARFATLLYIARDMQELVAHEIDSETLERAQADAIEIIRKANVKSEDDLPPPFPPDKYPCTYSTTRGTAQCPFFSVCHSTYTTRHTESDLSSLVEDYLSVLSELNEAEQYLQPLKAQKEEYERLLKSFLKPAQVVSTSLGTVRLIETKQERWDTSAVRKLLSSLGLSVPTQTVVARRIEVNFVKEVS